MKKLNISASLSNHRELKPGFDSEIICVFYIVRVMATEMERGRWYPAGGHEKQFQS